MNNTELGKRIKELRKSRDMTQEDLANVLSLSRGAISNLEHGRRGLSLNQLYKLCEVFKVDVAYFGIEPTGEETIALLERAKLLFESDLPTEKKDELYLAIMETYLKTKKD